MKSSVFNFSLVVFVLSLILTINSAFSQEQISFVEKNYIHSDGTRSSNFYFKLGEQKPVMFNKKGRQKYEDLIKISPNAFDSYAKYDKIRKAGTILYAPLIIGSGIILAGCLKGSSDFSKSN